VRSQRLLVWQLSDQLRLEVLKLTSGERFDPDHKLRSQIDDAAGAVCRNIAEAFATDRGRDFARFVRLARSAIGDVQDGCRIAVTRKYVAEAEFRALREILARLYPALSSLLAEQTALSHSSNQPLAPAAKL
jgi:four helix bundle protein